MDKRLISKMIINCFKQYYGTVSMPIGEKDLEVLLKQIFQTKEAEPHADLYEVVNDTVYEFLTG
jgi:hypothetical protein